MGEPATKHELQEWFTTEEAAAYMRTTVNAILTAICRGKLRPDTRGGRGRTRSHRFRRATLDGYLDRGKSGA